MPYPSFIPPCPFGRPLRDRDRREFVALLDLTDGELMALYTDSLVLIRF